MNIYLTPAEVAGIIHARAGDLCHAVTYPGTESEEESVPELICSLREAVDALEEARIDKAEGHPIPPEDEVPVTEAEADEYPYETSNKIYELGNTLGYLASVKAEGRELPQDAATAVSALEKLVKAVKTLYGLNGKDEEPTGEALQPCEHPERLPRTAAEVEAMNS